MSDLEREQEQECEHDWKHIKTWEGDPTIPNGTNPIEYWECRKCGLEDWVGDFDHEEDDIDYDGFDL